MAGGAVERAFVGSPLQAAGGRTIIAPFQFILSGTEKLRITSINSLAGVIVRIGTRTVKSDGSFETHSWDHVPNSDRTQKIEDFPLGTGALLTITAFNAGTAPIVGQTFIAAHLVAGDGAAAVGLGTLFSGYVASAQALGWPGSPVTYTTDGGGFLRTFTGTDPAPSAEALEAVPTGARWEVLMFAIDLATSATAGNRQTRLSVLGNVGGIFHSAQPGIMAASQTRTLYWAAGMPIAVEISANANIAGLATPLLLKAGDTIGTITDGLKAGDNYSAPKIYVREWLEVQ